MAGIINFVEEQRQVYLYDFLIYVCGVEVSAYVQNLTITYTDRNAPGSADITLTNPFDQWLLTNNNFMGNYRITTDRYTETPKYQIYQAKRFLSAQTVFSTLYPQSTLVSTNRAILNSPALTTATTQDFLQRYSFGPGSLIFSRFDTVKIFIKNPSDPPTMDRWYPAFTGTVENKPFTTDYVNGMSTVTLQAYDIRAAMSGMRISLNPYTNDAWNVALQTNPYAQNQQVFFNSAAAGLFQDYYPTTTSLNSVSRQTFDNIFYGSTFPDMVSLVITGQTGWAEGNAPVNLGGIFGGVGHFQPGQVFKYANPSNKSVTETGVVTDLEDWDNLCLLGVDSSGNPRNDFMTFQECNSVGTTSFWKQANSPIEGRMHFLLPAQGLKISDMIRFSPNGLNNIMANPDWTNRYALVSQICQMIDYEWSVTGSGDIIFEFPMYDFFPEDFGDNQSIYAVDKHAVHDTLSDESGDIPAALEASGIVSSQFVQAQVNQPISEIASPLAISDNRRKVVFSNVLASKYGARVQSVSFTGVKTTDALQSLALIEFNKRLAEANKVSFAFSFRCWLRPNRPLLHVEKSRIGKLTNVTLTMPPLKEPTTSVALHSVRVPLGIQGDNKIQFQSITGGSSAPISYNAIFEPPDPLNAAKTTFNPDSGINVRGPSNTEINAPSSPSSGLTNNQLLNSK